MFSWLSSGDYSYEILDTLLCLLILDKYSFILSRRYTPSALIAILKHAYSPCVLSSFPSCVADVDLSSFFCSLPSLFRFRFGQRLIFYPVFSLRALCCLLGFGFCCDSFSIYIQVCTLIRTYADLTFLLLSVYDLFKLVIVCIIFCFYLFSC